MKQIPFRYKEEMLEEKFDNIYKLQHYTKKKNLALKHSVAIASAFIKKFADENKIDKSWELRQAIFKELNITEYIG